MFQDSELEEQLQSEEQEEEYSGYVDDEVYGADEFDIGDDDEEMMNF